MAGTKVNTYEITGNDDVDAIEETVDKTNKGKCAVSLTEMDTTVQPQIAAGSVVEVNGALFEFEADESISGTPSDGTVYIKLIPAGSPATLTAEFTATAPVWDDEKQGWYSPTAGEENYRYIPFIMKKSSSNYSNKYKFFEHKELVTIEITGTTDAGDAYTNVAYPPGFTQANTHVLAYKVYDTYLNGYRAVSDDGAAWSVELTSTDIEIITNGYQRGQLYRLSLGRYIS